MSVIPSRFVSRRRHYAVVNTIGAVGGVEPGTAAVVVGSSVVCGIDASGGQRRIYIACRIRSRRGSVCVRRGCTNRGADGYTRDTRRGDRTPAPPSAVIAARAIVLIDHRGWVVGATIHRGAAVVVPVGVASISSGRRPMSVIGCHGP